MVDVPYIPQLWLTQDTSKNNILIKNTNKFLSNKQVHLLLMVPSKISHDQGVAISHYLAHNVPDLLSVDDVRGVKHGGVAGPVLLSTVLVLSL